MKPIHSNSLTSILIEVTRKEFQEKGFDKIWDEIREKYKSSEYEIDSFQEISNGKILLISLKVKKYLYLSEEEF